jgi:NAD dependent epimerase/dehydratase family enzyme
VNLTSPNPVTNAEFTKALGRVLHRPTLLSVPPFALRAALGAELVDEALLASQRVLPAALDDAGFEFGSPDLDAALGALFS